VTLPPGTSRDGGQPLRRRLSNGRTVPAKGYGSVSPETDLTEALLTSSREDPQMTPQPLATCWKQSFPFSCGPAALGSVLVTLGWKPSRDRVREELEIWRESTAVACPGAHPFGLALAAVRRGFASRVRVSGPRPWLWAHIRSGHSFPRLALYMAVERDLLRQCAETHIPFLRSEGPPRKFEAGLLLVTAQAGRSADQDPHWIGLIPASDGLWIADPLRPAAHRSNRSSREWWEASGFEGTRSWVTIRPRTSPFEQSPRVVAVKPPRRQGYPARHGARDKGGP
jgi:hypothetical protein